MSRFALLLTEIDERLNLHQPAKGRILLEIAADIHDLFDYYQSCGMNEARQGTTSLSRIVFTVIPENQAIP